MAKKTRAAAHQSHGGPRHGGHGHGGGGHDDGKPPKHRHGDPYEDPDYDRKPPPEHPHEPPVNPRYPDQRIYGSYASRKPPVYVPHLFEHTCFKPRKEDYKPPVTCDEPDSDLCIRKDHRAFTGDEQNRFINAFSQVNAMGALGPLVDIHFNAVHQMHSNPRFLPWHRIYLLRLEELLMMVDPTVCIPYWKSSEEQAFPAWLLAFTPTVTLAGGPHLVNRNIGALATLPDAASVAAALANATFNPFASALEGVHNSGHVWVGGTMQSIRTAPADPVFWMHHAEIDRLWSVWQATHPTEHPPLAGAAAIMDPWSETEADTRDIEALGYAYA
jgi:tyrosinase